MVRDPFLNSLVHFRLVNAAISVSVVHAEHQSQLLIGGPVGGEVDHHDKVTEVDRVTILAEGTKCLGSHFLSFARSKHLGRIDTLNHIWFVILIMIVSPTLA